MNIINSFKSALFTKGDERMQKARREIQLLIIIKGINILTGFLLVPLTINYVTPSTYGIWLALSSIVIWVSYFDLGLPNGFRNKFAESLAKNNQLLARKYVSTTYALLAIIFAGILCVLIIVNKFADWSTILSVSSSLKNELHYTFLIICIFFSIRVVASVFTFMLMADQKPAKSAAVHTIGQVLSLIFIYILTIYTESNIMYLALAISGMPCITILFISFIAYCIKPYNKFAPTLRLVDFKLSKDILGIGIQFFIVTIINLLILQIINILISRELGPFAVTQYNIAFKYFSIIYMIMELIVSPFWSGYTEAFIKKDFQWMHIILCKLERLLLLSIIAIIIMLICTNYIIYIWIGDTVTIPFSLSLSMSIFVFFQTAYCIYSNLVNGTGKVRIQLVTFIITGLISIPSIYYSTHYFGLAGSLLLPTISYAIIALLCKIQINKIIYKTAKGIWNI